MKLLIEIFRKINNISIFIKYQFSEMALLTLFSRKLATTYVIYLQNAEINYLHFITNLIQIEKSIQKL